MTNDWAVSMSELQEGRSNDKERTNLINALRRQTLTHFRANGSGTSDGAGTWLTLWSGTVPTDASVGTQTRVVGRGTSQGVLFEVSCGFQNFAGVTTYIGATFTTTVNLTDNALFDVRWALSGNEVSLQVNDGAVQALSWQALISAITTV